MNETKRKYHFAIITENLSPFVGGGIAEWTHGMAENLCRLGHTVTVLAKWKKGVRPDIHRDKPYRVEPMYGHNWRRNRYWNSLYYLWKFLRKHPQAVVIATTWDLGEAFLRLKKHFPAARLIVVAHAKDVTKVSGKRMVKKLRKTVENAVLTVAVSRFTRREVIERVGEYLMDRVIFLPNGVDIRRFHYVQNTDDVREKLGIPPNSRVILTLARVIERKGHDLVIRALSDILSEFPETLYLIAGPLQEKQYYERLKKLIEKLRLQERVIFTHFVDDSDLNKIYSMCDVYVMVSRTIDERGDSEGFGITFLEANACQRPVIGSRSGGIPDAIEDGVNGFLVPPEDVNELKEKILQLFRNPEIARKIGQQGRERVERSFTWEKICEKLLSEFAARLEERG